MCRSPRVGIQVRPIKSRSARRWPHEARHSAVCCASPAATPPRSRCRRSTPAAPPAIPRRWRTPRRCAPAPIVTAAPSCRRRSSPLSTRPNPTTATRFISRPWTRRTSIPNRATTSSFPPPDSLVSAAPASTPASISTATPAIPTASAPSTTRSTPSTRATSTTCASSTPAICVWRMRAAARARPARATSAAATRKKSRACAAP